MRPSQLLGHCCHPTVSRQHYSAWCLVRCERFGGPWVEARAEGVTIVMTLFGAGGPGKVGLRCYPLSSYAVWHVSLAGPLNN